MKIKRIAAAGERGLLVELSAATGEDIRLLTLGARTVASATVAGHDSVLLIFEGEVPPLDEQALADCAEHVTLQRSIREIGVSFATADAPDLPLLLSAASMSHESFLSRVRELPLCVRYLGFIPGFAYIEGIPPEWSLPRRATPRIDVPAGSFAIAGTMAGFYPQRSPGGWNLIGRSGERFWRPELQKPNLLDAGDEIVIVPRTSVRTEPTFDIEVPPPATGSLVAEVTRSGQWTAIAAGGSVRRLNSGLPTGGAFDIQAAEAANHAVGNDSSAAVLEVTLVGPELRFTRDAALAWGGSPPEIFVDGRRIGNQLQFSVRGGQRLSIERLSGMRGVLAIRGGWEPQDWPSSPSPTPLREGSLLTAFDESGTPRLSSVIREDRTLIRAMPGPHPLSHEQRSFIEGGEWTVDNRSDRRGVRLLPDGAPPAAPALLPSLGMQFGTVQWHPDGALVALGPDHPITGGYLQPMTILRSELWKVAQLRPGDRVRWRLESTLQRAASN